MGAAANAFTSGIINAPNRLADSVVGLFNGGKRVFGDLVPDAFTPVNEDQRQDVEAANAVMLVAVGPDPQNRSIPSTRKIEHMASTRSRRLLMRKGESRTSTTSEAR